MAEKRAKSGAATSAAKRQKKDALYAAISAVGKSTDPFTPDRLMQHEHILNAPAILKEASLEPLTDQQRAARACKFLLAVAREYHEPVIANATLGLGAFAGKPITGDGGRLAVLEKDYGITKDIFESRRYRFYDHIVSLLREGKPGNDTEKTQPTFSTSRMSEALVRTARAADLPLQHEAPGLAEHDVTMPSDYEALSSTFHIHAFFDALRRSQPSPPRDDKEPKATVVAKRGELFNIIVGAGTRQALATSPLAQVYYDSINKDAILWSRHKPMVLVKDGSGHE